jgi:hypothetical protein
VPGRTSLPMTPRLLAPGIALCALAADAGGLQGIAFWLVLAAVPAAAAAAYAGVGDAIAGDGKWLVGLGTTLALAMLVLGSAAREQAPVGGAVPALAVSSVVAALIFYALPGLAWLLEPLRSLRTARPTPRASRA